MTEHLAGRSSEPAPYRLSFLVGGLLADEAAIAAPVYLAHLDWHSTRQELDHGNLLHARTQATAARIGRELVQRMAALTNAEIEHVASGPSADRKLLMWAAMCRRYALVAEFAEEVIRDRYLLGTATLGPGDFERFVGAKSLWHDELESLKPSTARKLRTNLYLALRQAGFLTATGQLVPVLLSATVQNFLSARQPSDIRFFPTPGGIL